MKKILVLGSTGMAGHMITLYLGSLKKYEIYNSSFRSSLNEDSMICDINNISNLKDLILNIKPDIIINTIGILNDKSDIDINYTVYINSFIPHFLEHIGALYNMKIIHLSTDCVFTGKKGEYIESDLKDESSIYGLSKNIGEIINHKDLTFRTSIIGPELKLNGKGLFHWTMKQDGIISGYTNVYWSGVTTLELAQAIDKAIDSNLCGLYHLVSPNKISKYNLLRLIQDIFELQSINIFPDNKKYSDKSMKNTRNDFNFKVKNYNDMLIELNLWMTNNKYLYNQYFIK